jgi:hypothetical protein
MMILFLKKNENTRHSAATTGDNYDNYGDEKEGKRKKGERDLEMNHSHYLMMDDGGRFNYDTKSYRTELCVQVAKLQHENELLSKVFDLM